LRKFKYRLERLLRYRRSLTRIERVGLARCVGELARAEEDAVNLRGNRNTVRIARLRTVESGTTSMEVRNLHEHMLRIDEAIDNADEEKRKAEEEVGKAREKLVSKRRDERAIELHRERRWKVWLRDYYRDENRVMDDIGNTRHVRIKTSRQ